MPLSPTTNTPYYSADLSHCLVGANPIIWSNDDFEELAGDVSLDIILSEMREAGYVGTELGHAYPRTAPELASAISSHGLRLVSGWHSTHLASRPWDEEKEAFQTHLNLLHTFGAGVVIVAECTHCIHGQRHAALGFGDNDRHCLNEAEWAALAKGMNRLVDIAASKGMKIAYHQHMGTVIQTESELERLITLVPRLRLVLDAGHLAFAGIDPVAIAERHAERVVHVHLKSVRTEVTERVRREGWSFHRAVCEGVFTVSGDGEVDYPAIFRRLAATGYAGWLVSEAEEDPTSVPAFPKARRARDYVRTQTGA